MLTLTVVSLAIVDSINPTIIAGSILLILYRGAWAGWAYIIGVLLTTWFQGIALYFGASHLLHQILWLNIPHAQWILIVVGLGVIAYGLHCWKHRYNTPGNKKWRSPSSVKYTSYIKDIILGSATTLAETPTALFLVIAALEVQQAGVNAFVALLYFCLYAALYTLPVVALTGIAAWQEKRLKSWFSGRLNSIYIRLNIGFSIAMVALGILIFATGLSLLSGMI
jgi:cytochrome c biogenesis protein CcdA